MMMDNVRKISIVYRLIKYIIAFLILALVIKYRAFFSSVLAPFFISALFAYLLKPIVLFFERKGLKRILSVIFVYVIFLTLIVFIGLFIIPKLFKDISNLVESIPAYTMEFEKMFKRFQDGYINSNLPKGLKNIIDDNINNIENTILLFLQKVADSLINFFSKMFNFFIVPVLTFYMLKDSEYFKNQLILIIPKSNRKKILQLFKDIDNVFGKYIRGQIFISSIVGIVTTIALVLIKVKYPLILGIFAGLSNIIPYFGPIIGMIPTIIFALLDSPIKALYAAGAYLLVQQMESGIITPKIIGESVGLHPIYVIMALMIGGKVFGIVGLIIAVPLAAITKLCLKHFLRSFI